MRAGEATLHLLAEKKKSQLRRDDRVVDAYIVEPMSNKQAQKALKRGAECNFVNVTKDEGCSVKSVATPTVK